MKTLFNLTVIAVLIAGISIASAQNAPTATPNASPNAINKSNLPSNKSGNESQTTAKKGSKAAEKKMKQGTTGTSPSSR